MYGRRVPQPFIGTIRLMRLSSRLIRGVKWSKQCCARQTRDWLLSVSGQHAVKCCALNRWLCFTSNNACAMQAALRNSKTRCAISVPMRMVGDFRRDARPIASMRWCGPSPLWRWARKPCRVSGGYKREGFLLKRPVCRPCVFAGRFTKSVRVFLLNRSVCRPCVLVCRVKICRSVPSHASLRGDLRRGSPVFGFFARRALFFLDCFALLAMTRFKRKACSPVASLKSARDFIETTGLPTLRFGLSRKNLPVYALTCVTARRAASWQSRRTLVGQRICTARLDCIASLAMTRFKRKACSPVASLKSARDFIETIGLPTLRFGLSRKILPVCALCPHMRHCEARSVVAVQCLASSPEELCFFWIASLCSQ